jgi:hypothetical protein
MLEFKSMKKITILLSTIFTIGIVTSCDNEAKREQEYATLLEKEYPEFLTSERAKKYKERYELLQSVTKQIENEAPAKPEAKAPAVKLCFTPDDEYNLTKKEKNPTKSIKTFEEYTNLSPQINAVIVGTFFQSEFFAKKSFDGEQQLHAAYLALDKDAFLKECQSDRTENWYAYQEFSKARVQMDKLNNSKYFVILKETKYQLPEEVKGQDAYTSGEFAATLYVYDIAAKQIVYATDIRAENSDSVEYGANTDMNTVKDDLLYNAQAKIEQALDSAMGVNGITPLYTR